MEPIDGHATLAELDAVADDLAWLDPAPFFFGASVLPLYLDDGTLSEEARPTDDVDVLIAVVAPGPMHLVTANLEAGLRARGWTHDLRPGRKNIHAFVTPSGVPVDLVLHRPCGPSVDAVTVEDWPLRASSAPMLVHRTDERILRVPTPAYFLACKIAASRNPQRWSGPHDAKDVEDIALLLAGCGRVLDTARPGPPELRAMLTAWATEVRSGSTTYGKNVRELLLANAPRSVSADMIIERLAALASMAA
jgi:hypothetical protein